MKTRDMPSVRGRKAAHDSREAALRAQVAAMAEWAAKVKHERDCSSVNNCGCMNRKGNCDYCAEFVKGDCDCILADLPADLIARGRELMADSSRLDWVLKNRHILVQEFPGKAVVWDQSSGLRCIGRGSNGREAIDNAIKRESNA